MIILPFPIELARQPGTMPRTSLVCGPEDAPTAILVPQGNGEWLDLLSPAHQPISFQPRKPSWAARNAKMTVR